ncbi:MAG TPA: hypothetical protein VNU27_00695 [Candidatus Acidoferrum sp.]|nr:hypothetical protein [Candidatus Acidoferrum sp.]
MLISPLSSASYTVSLVGIDGRVVASQVASTPGTVTCAGQAAGVVPPPVSTSNSRVYFMDALGVVRYLAPDGDAGQVITLPIGPARRSLFAVSPDDALMAVVVIDFIAGGANTSLYMYQLQPGGAQLLLFRQTGSYILWPTGWHGTTSLVLAKVPSCTQGGGPLCCGPQEFHVVDPKTAVRRFTVGGAACVITGPPSPAGAVCEDTTAYAQANVLDWTGATVHSYPVTGPTPAYLSPDGTLLAVPSNTAPTTLLIPTNAALNLNACGWIDNTHVLSGGDAQHQPSVGDVTDGQVVPVAALGDCAGRIPGGL